MYKFVIFLVPTTTIITTYFKPNTQQIEKSRPGPNIGGAQKKVTASRRGKTPGACHEDVRDEACRPRASFRTQEPTRNSALSASTNKRETAVLREHDAIDGRGVVSDTDAVGARPVVRVVVVDHVAKASRHDAEHGQKDAVSKPLLDSAIRQSSNHHGAQEGVQRLLRGKDARLWKE